MTEAGKNRSITNRLREKEQTGRSRRMEDYTLRNYIPIGGPATRQPADGTESPFRVSLGFSPRWYHDRMGIDFSQRWHKDPVYRYETLVQMKTLLHDKFPQVEAFCPVVNEQGIEESCATLDGAYGAMLIAEIYGLEVHYYPDNWPSTDTSCHFTREELEGLEPFRLEENRAFHELMGQMDCIAERWGKISGYLNYQGVLNNALRLRGQDIFLDMYDDPEFVHHLFRHITETMIAVAKAVQKRQRESGFFIDLFSCSNCVMNMISAEMYEEFVLPYDQQLSREFSRFGIHTCNWNATPYIDSLSRISKMGYIDMGMDTDMERMRRVFPHARRAVLYSPVRAETLPAEEIRKDMKKIADELAPCDFVLADLETTMSDERVREILDEAQRLSGELENRMEEKG